MKNFPTLMGVQKLKLRCRIELIEYFYIQLSFDFFKKKVKYFFCIFFYFNVVFLCVEEDVLITEIGI
jgi:hypothetical protein